MTIGQKLFEAGFRSTTWLNQQTGEEEHGAFDPTKEDAKERYGNPAGQAVKDWPPRNKVGPHATGDMTQVTVELARKVLGAEHASDRWDLADLDFVEGAGAHVLKLAKASGDIVPQSPQPGAVPGPGPAVPAPFDTSHVPDLDAKLNALAEKIISKLDSLKGGGDDKAKLALQHLSLKVAEIQALSTPKHQRFDDLVAAISAAVAEGGA